MKNSIFSNPALDEITFEHRNHAYGAFAIRRNYDRNMTRATIMSILLFVTAFLSPAVIDLLLPEKILPEITEVIFSNDLVHEPIFERVMEPRLNQGIIDKNEMQATSPDEVTRVVNDHSENLSHEQPKESNTDLLNSKDVLNENSTSTGQGRESGTDPMGSTTGNISGSNSSDEVFLVPDELPSFGENKSDLIKYILNQINIPVEAKENRIEGKVIVEFIIGKNGEVNSVRVLRGLGWGCDEEVIRVIEEMPKWKAGKHHGKPVQVKLILPVAFKYN
jgi:protein TonB